jgi:Amt family ammonium transporter
MVGAGLLWVGWFGFNAGSALGANGLAAVAMMNSFAAPAAGALVWMAAERFVSGKPSMLGGASGAVVGLVAITPAAGVSGPVGAMLLGSATSLVCYAFVGSLKNRLRLDDSLDVFGIDGLGGIIGSIGTAFVALPILGGYGGADYALGPQLLRQVAAVSVAIGWSAAGPHYALRWYGRSCRCATSATSNAKASTSPITASVPTPSDYFFTAAVRRPFIRSAAGWIAGSIRSGRSE